MRIRAIEKSQEDSTRMVPLTTHEPRPGPGLGGPCQPNAAEPAPTRYPLCRVLRLTVYEVHDAKLVTPG